MTFDLRGLVRQAIEDHPDMTPTQFTDLVVSMVPESDLREALRQTVSPLVRQAFEEFVTASALARVMDRRPSSPPRIPLPDPLPSVLSPAAPSDSATTDRGDSDHTPSASHSMAVAATPSLPAGGDHPPAVSQPDLVTPGRPRRTKTSLVRTHAKTWMEQKIRTGGGGVVPLGSATFQDLMDATAARRRSAYTAMAKADTLERLAKLLDSQGVATVSELPAPLLASFASSNPEL